MKNSKFTAIAVVLGALSFSACAAPSSQTMQNDTAAKKCHACEVEAGSNLVPGTPSTGKTMDDAFNAHTLVAGEWY